MAVATRPSNLIRRVLDPTGSLGGEPLEWSIVLAVVMGVGFVALRPAFPPLSAVPDTGLLIVMLWREKTARRLKVETEDPISAWFIPGVVLFVTTELLLAFLGGKLGCRVAEILIGSLLPLALIISTRQLSKDVARRVP